MIVNRPPTRVGEILETDRDILCLYVLMPDYDPSELHVARGATIPEMEADAAARAALARRAWEQLV